MHCDDVDLSLKSHFSLSKTSSAWATINANLTPSMAKRLEELEDIDLTLNFNHPSSSNPLTSTDLGIQWQHLRSECLLLFLATK